MLRHRLYVCVVVSLIWLLAGCGGDGGTPPAQTKDVGTASGSIETEGNAPGAFQLILDGQTVPSPVGPDGKFRIPNIPPGPHVLDVLGPDGMSGGRAEFNVVPGVDSEIPPIRPVARGQIAGLVLKWENDTLVPAGGVEVIARSDLYWVADGTGEGRTVSSAQSTEPMPLIYPPPPGETYSAFTNRSGSYLMQNVLPGPYMISVVVPGFFPAHQFVIVRPGQTSPVDFRLRPAVTPEFGKIEGTVANADPTTNYEPIEGALIQVTIDDPWVPPWPGPMGGPVPEPIEIPAGLDFPTMGVAPAQSGGSSEPGGTAPGFVPPDIRWRVFSTQTDEEGKYELKVPAGRRIVQCWAWGFEAQHRPVIVPEGGTLRVDFRLLPMPMPEPIPMPGPMPGPTRPDGAE